MLELRLKGFVPLLEMAVLLEYLLLVLMNPVQKLYLLPQPLQLALVLK